MAIDGEFWVAVRQNSWSACTGSGSSPRRLQLIVARRGGGGCNGVVAYSDVACLAEHGVRSAALGQDTGCPCWSLLLSAGYSVPLGPQGEV